MGRPRADDVDAEQTTVVAMEEHFEKTAVVADDLSARDLSIPGDTDLVGNARLRQLGLRRADHRNLRHGVDPDREMRGHRSGGNSKRVTRGEAPLLTRRRREAWISDDITSGKDVRDRRSEFLVDDDSTARVGSQTGILEQKLGGRANTTN